jgi:antitoxin component YwqK of YwqJK toxin-antitoxin module
MTAKNSTSIIDHYGYKKCQDNRIVKLEILGDHNEARENIVDKRFAKMRCSMARVIRIYNMNDPSINYDEAFGIHDKTFRYKVGDVVKPVNEYNKDINSICSSGIHYFLTKIPAYNWDYKPDNGLYEEWHENGQTMQRCIYKDGKEDGLYEKWYENGQMYWRCIYKDGKEDGLYESWHENGQTRQRCIYKDGKKNGLYELWHENGQMYWRCIFKDGKKNGLYESWYENGQTRQRCIYKDGKRDGLYELWHENGQMNWRCIYKDGKEDGSYESWHENGQMYWRCIYKDGIMVR